MIYQRLKVDPFISVSVSIVLAWNTKGIQIKKKHTKGMIKVIGSSSSPNFSRIVAAMYVDSVSKEKVDRGGNGLKKQDRSRRCKYIQSNMTFSLFLPFFLQKLLIKSTKYYQIRDQRV